MKISLALQELIALAVIVLSIVAIVYLQVTGVTLKRLVDSIVRGNIRGSTEAMAAENERLGRVLKGDIGAPTTADIRADAKGFAQIVNDEQDVLQDQILVASEMAIAAAKLKNARVADMLARQSQLYSDMFAYLQNIHLRYEILTAQVADTLYE